HAATAGLHTRAARPQSVRRRATAADAHDQRNRSIPATWSIARALLRPCVRIDRMERSIDPYRSLPGRDPGRRRPRAIHLPGLTGTDRLRTNHARASRSFLPGVAAAAA